MTDIKNSSTEECESKELTTESGQKTGIVRGAVGFLENTFNSLKGKDINKAVEEFTSEMTIVCEGLSEDQEMLRKEVENASAQLTILEENARSNRANAENGISELRKTVEKIQKKLNVIDDLQLKIAELEKTFKTQQKEKKQGLTAILRQATWLVGIAAGAWIITTILKMF